MNLQNSSVFAKFIDQNFHTIWLYNFQRSTLPEIFCYHFYDAELQYYIRIIILWGKNLAATIPAAPKVALPRRKLLQVPLIVLYLTKLVGASSGTFCEVQKLGGCCIGLRHWSKELPKFRRNGPGDI